jgi:hypothetical protein
MSGQIKLDIGHLKQMGTSLGQVANDFENADVYSDGIASATGHDGLAAEVRDFANSWDDKREKMVEGIRGLGEIAAAVADTFKDFDDQYAAALTETEVE